VTKQNAWLEHFWCVTSMCRKGKSWNVFQYDYSMRWRSRF